MNSTKENLLSWDEISEKVDKNQELNPIDNFLYANTPAGEEEEIFRKQFYDALNCDSLNKVVNYKKLSESFVKNLLKQYSNGEISFGKFVECLNEQRLSNIANVSSSVCPRCGSNKIAESDENKDWMDCEWCSLRWVK